MPNLTEQELAILERVDGWIAEHYDEYVADIVTWATVPSTARPDEATPGAPFGPDVAKVFEVAAARAAELGFAVEEHDGYAISVLSGTAGDDASQAIGLVSHLDVVPEGDHWTLEAYQPIVRDGFIIGRGVSDNKGPAVGDLYLLRLFRDLGIPLKHSLRIIYGGAEEIGMGDLAYYATNGPIPKLSIVTDGPFPVNYAQKGNLNVRVFLPTGPALAGFTAGVAENAVPASATLVLPDTTLDEVREALEAARADYRDLLDLSADGSEVTIVAHGHSGHAAFPEGTLNAILVLSTALVEAGLLSGTDLETAVALETILATPYGDGSGAAREDEASGQLTQNGGLIRLAEGGIYLHLDIRYPVTADHNEIIDAIAETAARFGGHVADYEHAQPFYIEKTDPVVTLLQQSFNDVLDATAEPFAMGGGTHSRVLPRAITFGPGLGRNLAGLPDESVGERPDFIPAHHGGAHGPDEFVRIQNLITGLRIYVIALIRLDEQLSSND
ncbi:Sapep family Mn(2+)-dependent dipeptidase [Lysinibacter cavernae]|uniref:Succinyl-diaminopimelate desuccinylase n=1 Tax=Lysinibacter cavernae TaxID=1640652 RepID=A0A7X5TST6_9MICO|nr:Sapep family Mn(2+)-dependent dipeptidase [Lysinibacter cavernae]NIH52583.1 succinyl-diaminopimelate desuccinylase [Lysinibacter cavernae]